MAFDLIPTAGAVSSSASHCPAWRGEEVRFKSDPQAYCTSSDLDRARYIEVAGQWFDLSQNPLLQKHLEEAKRNRDLWNWGSSFLPTHSSLEESQEIPLPAEWESWVRDGLVTPMDTPPNLKPRCVEELARQACATARNVLTSTPSRVAQAAVSFQNAAWAWLKPSGSSFFGFGSWMLGNGFDFNGDGRPDVVIGATYNASVCYGSTLTAGQNNVSDSGPSVILGGSLGDGINSFDANHDGHSEVSLNEAELVNIYFGPSIGNIPPSISGLPSWTTFRGVAGPTSLLALSINATGFGGYPSGTFFRDPSNIYFVNFDSPRYGQVFNFLGTPPDILFSLSDASLTLAVPTTFADAGGVAMADFDGNGRLDLAIAMKGTPGSSAQYLAGRVVILFDDGSGYPANVTLPHPTNVRYAELLGDPSCLGVRTVRPAVNLAGGPNPPVGIELQGANAADPNCGTAYAFVDASQLAGSQSISSIGTTTLFQVRDGSSFFGGRMESFNVDSSLKGMLFSLPGSTNRTASVVVAYASSRLSGTYDIRDVGPTFASNNTGYLGAPAATTAGNTLWIGDTSSQAVYGIDLRSYEPASVSSASVLERPTWTRWLL